MAIIFLLRVFHYALVFFTSPQWDSERSLLSADQRDTYEQDKNREINCHASSRDSEFIDAIQINKVEDNIQETQSNNAKFLQNTLANLANRENGDEFSDEDKDVDPEFIKF